MLGVLYRDVVPGGRYLCSYCILLYSVAFYFISKMYERIDVLHEPALYFCNMVHYHT